MFQLADIMAATLFETLSQFFARYGCLVVFLGVMLENVGFPLPGETVLLFASFLAYQHRLNLPLVIVTAIAGATIGSSLGYLIGRAGGQAVIRKYRLLLPGRRFQRAQQSFLHWGHWAVFVARFITGLRVLAGPLAGAFLMPYPRFLLFTFAGAVAWATAIGSVGFFLGGNWQRLVAVVVRVDWIILAGAVILALILIYRHGRARPADGRTR